MRASSTSLPYAVAHAHSPRIPGQFPKLQVVLDRLQPYSSTAFIHVPCIIQRAQVVCSGYRIPIQLTPMGCLLPSLWISTLSSSSARSLVFASPTMTASRIIGR